MKHPGVGTRILMRENEISVRNKNPTETNAAR